MKFPSICSLPLLGLAMIEPSVVLADPVANLRDLTGGDPFFYTSDQYVREGEGQKALVGVGRPSTTHSRIPHLPFYMGYMNTNYTYRFVSVAEQVLIMIGEGKHGLWRTQENGFVREYRKKGAAGLEKDANLEDPKNFDVIKKDYASYLPDESYAGYKYPDEQLSADGRLNFIDLPISHAKYEAKYADHEPIDLANYYCTMSEADYPYAFQAVNFAFSQPGANVVGPLGRRAGLDIKENYTRVLRLKQFPDARTWVNGVNVGQPGRDSLHVDWKAVDYDRTDAEFYLVERPFFNKPYLFVVAVYEPKSGNGFAYLRPNGAYFRSLGDRAKGVRTTAPAAPTFPLKDGGTGQAVGLPIYGVHHPDRAAYSSGGACPLKGGDWGRYPDPRAGSGWPTQYEEVTPLCDAVLIDIKFYSNLDGRDWSDPDKYLANAGAGTRTVEYKMQPGTYGIFTDPYNVAAGRSNPEQQEVPDRLSLNYRTVQKPVSYVETAKPTSNTATAPVPSTSCRQALAK
ncbi:hypothetical protein [Methylobacterium nodulans]|uniref:DUF1329 domain-containing protein n=1 Tax=Methylobacterium nodulans (strain LMG 21967 / CNCM I-2342 / ORS 2060) TaxID=460265 RepID=B8IKY1_METNO|nr:hypothetical protein [Methylobacterium nodulans]ACL58169.1 hypothetical protein Mnod_3245 [Methylobacterium nodulans ORS 2060]